MAEDKSVTNCPKINHMATVDRKMPERNNGYLSMLLFFFIDTPLIFTNMKKIKYVLISVSESEKEGGIKQVYDVYENPVKRITIRIGKLTKLHLYLPKRIAKTKQRITFLKPLKAKWDTKRNKVSKNFWGKKLDPYMNMWVIVKETIFATPTGDQKRILSVKDSLRSHTDHTLIAHLNKRHSKFTLFIN